jgi:predicted GTPase
LKEAIVIGRPNVGKTLLTINLAEFLGQRRVEVMFRPRDGAAYTCIYSIAQARADLVAETPHRTRCLQSLVLSVPRGKGVRKVVVTDTTGLCDEIHPSSAVRRAMADTIRSVARAVIILHVVDPLNPLSGVDLDILRFGQTQEGYALVANMMDLPGRAEQVPQLVRAARPAPVFPVSALKRTGLGEVRAFLRRHL